MPVRPWTQRVVIRWRSALRFYEERIAILRALEGLGLLHAFQVAENRISARLGDEDHEVVVTSSSLTLRLLSPDGDVARLTSAARTVFEAIRPKRARPQIVLQHLVPVERDYELYRRESARTFLATSPLETLSVTDWAFLLTGVVEHLSTEVNAEFGIVSQAEIPARIARLVGGIGAIGDRDPDLAPDRWNEGEFPSVAFFSDSVWDRKEELDSDLLTESLSEFWDAVVSEGGRLVDELQRRVGTETTADVALAMDQEFDERGEGRGR